MRRRSRGHLHLNRAATGRRPGRGLAVLMSAIALALLAGPHAVAAAEDIDEATRWVPAFGFYFDVFGQKARGTADSGDVLGPPFTEDPADPLNGCRLNEADAGSPDGRQHNDDLCPVSAGLQNNTPVAPLMIQPSSAATDTNVAPIVGLDVELMTPRLLEGFLQPRLFVRGEAAMVFGFERNLAAVSRPGGFSPPADIPPLSTDIEEETVLGQGVRTKLETETLMLAAGTGLAFTVDAFNRRLRIKPSFEYVRQEIEVSGTVRRAVKQVEQVAGPHPPSELRPDEWRFISLEATDEVILHGFGPGLEIEADTLNLGPFLMSTYIMGRGYYFTGDLDGDLTATNEFGETATFTYELDEWGWRTGVGVRFRWLPE